MTQKLLSQFKSKTKLQRVKLILQLLYSFQTQLHRQVSKFVNEEVTCTIQISRCAHLILSFMDPV